MTDKLLQRMYLAVGIALTGYMLWSAVRRTMGHAQCNRTDGWCFTHDKALS